MRRLFTVCIILFATLSAQAQLSLKDITTLLKPLNKSLDQPCKELVSCLDTLQVKNEVLVALPATANNITTIGFENAVDTVRKETVQLSSFTQGTVTKFSITVTTRDITQYNGWMKAATADTAFIIDRKKLAAYDHRVFSSLPSSTEKRSYDFSVQMKEEPPKKKHIYIFQVVYTREYDSSKNIKAVTR